MKKFMSILVSVAVLICCVGSSFAAPREGEYGIYARHGGVVHYTYRGNTYDATYLDKDKTIKYIFDVVLIGENEFSLKTIVQDALGALPGYFVWEDVVAHGNATIYKQIQTAGYCAKLVAMNDYSAELSAWEDRYDIVIPPGATNVQYNLYSY